MCTYGKKNVTVFFFIDLLNFVNNINFASFVQFGDFFLTEDPKVE